VGGVVRGEGGGGRGVWGGGVVVFGGGCFAWWVGSNRSPLSARPDWDPPDFRLSSGKKGDVRFILGTDTRGLESTVVNLPRYISYISPENLGKRANTTKGKPVIGRLLDAGKSGWGLGRGCLRLPAQRGCEDSERMNVTRAGDRIVRTTKKPKEGPGAFVVVTREDSGSSQQGKAARGFREGREQGTINTI